MKEKILTELLGKHAVLIPKEEGLGDIARLTCEELQEHYGLPKGKATILKAAFRLADEKLAERYYKARYKFESSEDVAWYMRSVLELQDSPIEKFVVIALNSRNEIVNYFTASVGTMNCTLVDVKVICKWLLQQNCTQVIVGHNHPSGNPEPSSQDNVTTRRLKDAFDILEIKLLDHIIVAKQKHYSYLDAGKL